MQSPKPCRISPFRRLAPPLAALTITAGCGAPSMLVTRAEPTVADDAVTELWSRDIHRVARTGDWILSRSYSMVGDVITLSTVGESLSHASIYDAERGTIIEARNPRVREVPLEDLLSYNRFVIVVRPAAVREEARIASVERARSVIGAAFDYAGIFGVGSSDRFYCSELVAWAAEIDDPGLVVSPSDLFERGEVVYFSGARDEPAVRAAALASRDLRLARAVEGAPRVADAP